MAVYSFQSVVATIVGPGGVLDIGAGAAVSEEGITIEPTEDKNVMTIGADGQGQHSLVAGEAAMATVRLLKTSPVNAALMIMYNLQRASAALWGKNVISVNDTARGDYNVLQSVAFKKKPTIVYDKAGPMMEWTFDCIAADSILGSGNQ